MSQCSEIVDASVMVRRIAKWVREGGGILPLTGAGLSVPAGIAPVVQLEGYLRYCVVRSVADFVKPGAIPWTPYYDPWPVMDVGRKDREDRDAGARSLSGVVAKLRRRAEKDWNWINLLEKAIGACAGWTDSLLFLSRLQRNDGREAKGLLAAPHQWIVDSFVRHLVAHKNPCLEHRMLAILADLLRIRVSMTTNFDDLFERACQDVGKDVAAMDVHIEAGLPPANVVFNAGPVLLKLHGGRYGYRADFSLDAMPTSDDRREFASYLYGAPIDPKRWEKAHAPVNREPLSFEKSTAIPRALLLIGVSGNDPRIMEMIASATGAFDAASGARPKIFWITFTRKQAKDVLANSANVGGELVVCHEPYAGLLLLHLYQELTGSLPAASPETPSMWRLATPPRREAEDGGADNAYKAAAASVLSRLGGRGRGRAASGRIVYVTAAAETERNRFADLVGVAAGVYEKSVERCEGCVWIELDEVANADELFDRVLEAMAKRVGDERRLGTRASDTLKLNADVRPLRALYRRDDDRRRELERLARRIDKPWTIFLVGIEHFGRLTGYESRKEAGANRRPAWRDVRALHRLTAGCAAAADIRMVVTGMAQAVPSVETVACKGIGRSFADPRGEIENDLRFSRFVRLHCLFDRSRYPASFSLWAASLPSGGEDEQEEKERVEKYIDCMVKSGWARHKSGGFLWLHPEAKNSLVKYFESLGPRPSGVTDADCHQAIADWYWKLFVGSKTPSSLFDSIRHRIRCFEAAGADKDRRRNLSTLREIQTSLRAGAQILLSRGYTPGTCERLQKLKAHFKKMEGSREYRHEARTIVREVAKLLFRLSLEVVESRKIVARMVEREAAERTAREPDGGKRRPTPPRFVSILERTWAGIKTRRNVESEIRRALAKVRRDSLPGLGANRTSPCLEPRCAKLIKEHRDWGGQIGYRLKNDPASIVLLLRLYRRLMFSDLERAEVCRMLSHYVGAAGRAEKEHHSFKRHLDRALNTYHLAFEMARFLPGNDADDLVRERVQLKQLFGAVLSSLSKHMEAEKRFHEAHALLGCYYSADPPRAQLAGITKVFEAEAKLRFIYLSVPSFRRRFDSVTDDWNRTHRGRSPAEDPVAMAADRAKVLGLLRDTDSILESVKEMKMGTRKDHFWMSRYYYAAIRAQVFRCVVLAGSGQEERLLESRGEGLPSGICQISFLLNAVSRIVRTDVFIFARCCHQAWIAHQELTRHLPKAVRNPNAREGRLLRREQDELKALDDAIQRCRSILEAIYRGLKSNERAMPDADVRRYVEYALKRLKKPGKRTAGRR